MVTEGSGKVFKAEQGMRRCKVCEELFTRAAAAQHSTVPCQPKPEALAAAAGQSH
jgi:hypothetical protein